MQPTELPLKDIHLPDVIGLWPPAIGWWLLVLLIPVSLFASYRLYRYLTRKTAVKAAKKELALIKLYEHQDTEKKLRELSILMRRVAISVSPRAEVASLTGREWLAFLDQSMTRAPFSQGYGQLLTEAVYRKELTSELEITQLIRVCEDWLKAQTRSMKRK